MRLFLFIFQYKFGVGVGVGKSKPTRGRLWSRSANRLSGKLPSKTDGRHGKIIHELFIFAHAPMRASTLEASIRRHLPHKGQCGLRGQHNPQPWQGIVGRGQWGWESSVRTRVLQCVFAWAQISCLLVVPQNTTYVTGCAACVRCTASRPRRNAIGEDGP